MSQFVGALASRKVKKAELIGEFAAQHAALKKGAIAHALDAVAHFVGGTWCVDQKPLVDATARRGVTRAET